MYETQHVTPTGINDNSFMNSVYLFFGLALLVSGLGAYFAPYILPASTFAFYGCMALELILVFTARMWSEKKPLNMFLFVGFAFLSGLTTYPLLAIAGATGGFELIGQALMATFFMFAAAGTYGYVTEKDLTSMGGFLFMALIGLIVVGILQIFWFNSMVELISSGIGILVFAGFTAYDIQKIKNSHYSSPIIAALHLYLDIFNLFIYILRFMMATRD